MSHEYENGTHCLINKPKKELTPIVIVGAIFVIGTFTVLISKVLAETFLNTASPDTINLFVTAILGAAVTMVAVTNNKDN